MISSTLNTAEVVRVRHWTDTQFSFSTTRPRSLRFENGQFLMLGLMVEDRPLLRAYSIASANHEDELDFLSIKAPAGPLTTRLQQIRAGDPILLGRKPTGSLLLSDLRSGKHLYLLCSGTGVAPFLGLIKDPDIYGRFERIILVHGVRWVRETRVAQDAVDSVKAHEVLGGWARAQLTYYPTVTREPFQNQGRVTTQLASAEVFRKLDLPALHPVTDRAMVCGSPQMLADTRRLLGVLGFVISPRIGEPGDYVVERAFVEHK